MLVIIAVVTVLCHTPFSTSGAAFLMTPGPQNDSPDRSTSVYLVRDCDSFAFFFFFCLFYGCTLGIPWLGGELEL